MKMPDPARRERQRALIEKGIETPFFRDHIKVFEKTVAEMEVQLGKTQWLACDRYTLADAEITPYIERVDRLGLAGLWENRPTRRSTGLRVSKLARASRGSRTIRRPTTMTPVVMGSRIGHGSKS